MSEKRRVPLDAGASSDVEADLLRVFDAGSIVNVVD